MKKKTTLSLLMTGLILATILMVSFPISARNKNIPNSVQIRGTLSVNVMVYGYNVSNAIVTAYKIPISPALCKIPWNSHFNTYRRNLNPGMYRVDVRFYSLYDFAITNITSNETTNLYFNFQ
jgi:hypothetical protein